MSENKHQKLSLNPKAMKIIKDCAVQGLSDKKIQQRLMEECGYRWTVNTISKRRRSIGVIKKPGQPINTETVGDLMLQVSPPGLTDNEKAHWFRDQLKKTSMFRILKRQFDPEEISNYVEDFGLLCCQFEDIVVSEYMQIDDLLKQRLQINRLLIETRLIQQQIADLQEWLLSNSRKDDEPKEMTRLRLIQQKQLDDRHQLIEKISKRCDELVKARDKMYGHLAATRKDRLDELRGGKETFLELVGRLQHSQDERDREGRFAELTKLAAEDVKIEFRKPIRFPDGSIEPIIMDSETNFGEDADE